MPDSHTLPSNKTETGDLHQVILKARKLIQQIDQATLALHQESNTTPALRDLLACLCLRGPMTVPQIAAEKKVSRQNIQTLVNILVERKLVELVANPKHRRSPRLKPAKQGKLAFQQMRQRESEALASMVGKCDSQALKTTVKTLNELGDYLEKQAFEKPANSQPTPAEASV